MYIDVPDTGTVLISEICKLVCCLKFIKLKLIIYYF